MPHSGSEGLCLDVDAILERWGRKQGDGLAMTVSAPPSPTRIRQVPCLQVSTCCQAVLAFGDDPTSSQGTISGRRWLDVGLLPAVAGSKGWCRLAVTHGLGSSRYFTDMSLVDTSLIVYLYEPRVFLSLEHTHVWSCLLRTSYARRKFVRQHKPRGFGHNVMDAISPQPCPKPTIH